MTQGAMESMQQAAIAGPGSASLWTPWCLQGPANRFGSATGGNTGATPSLGQTSRSTQF